MNESVSIIYCQETGQILKMKSNPYVADQELGKNGSCFWYRLLKGYNIQIH